MTSWSYFQPEYPLNNLHGSMSRPSSLEYTCTQNHLTIASSVFHLLSLDLISLFQASWRPCSKIKHYHIYLTLFDILFSSVAMWHVIFKEFPQKYFRFLICVSWFSFILSYRHQLISIVYNRKLSVICIKKHQSTKQAANKQMAPERKRKEIDCFQPSFKSVPYK